MSAGLLSLLGWVGASWEAVHRFITAPPCAQQWLTRLQGHQRYSLLRPPRRSPPTAVRLLDEFVQLGEGDTLVQSGATSHVGKVRLQGAESSALLPCLAHCCRAWVVAAALFSSHHPTLAPPAAGDSAGQGAGHQHRQPHP